MKGRILSVRFVETILLVSLILMSAMLYILPVEAECTEQAKKKTIKVVKHIVKGSGVTKEQLQKWDEKAQEAWKCTLVLDVEYAKTEADNVGDNKVAGAVNVYGVPVNDDYYGCARPPDVIEAAQDAKPDTLAHEFGHIPGGKCTEDDHRQDDTENLMYSGCARSGSKVTAAQQDRAREQADKWLEEANPHKTGSGTQKKDPRNDTSKPFIDITYTDAWAQYNSLLLSITVDFFVNMSYSLGYFIESDSNASTGEPPLGIDYIVYFDPQQNHIYFFRYDLDWIPLDTTGISVKYLYEVLDAKVPEPPLPLQKEIGIEFEIPLTLLTRRAGDIVSLVAFTEFESYFDICPDEGTTSIQYIKDHDMAILSLTPSKTVVGVGNLMQIGVIVWNEGNSWESFSVSVFYNASLIGTLYVGSLPPGSEYTLIFNWNTAEVPKGKYILSANASAVPGETDLIDNTYERWNTIQVTGNGDLNGDLIVDIFDIVTIALAFGAVSNDTNWWPNADVVQDYIIDIFDLVSVALRFGTVYPP
jgi:hypothetical protein